MEVPRGCLHSASSPRRTIHSSSPVTSASFKTQYLHIPHKQPMGMYYGNICMENQCVSHSLFSKHVSSGYLYCKPDQLILNAAQKDMCWCYLPSISLWLPQGFSSWIRRYKSYAADEMLKICSLDQQPASFVHSNMQTHKQLNPTPFICKK